MQHACIFSFFANLFAKLYSQTHIRDLALGSKKTKNASSCASKIITLSKDRKKTPFWEHWTAMYLTLFAWVQTKECAGQRPDMLCHKRISSTKQPSFFWEKNRKYFLIWFIQTKLLQWAHHPQWVWLDRQLPANKTHSETVTEKTCTPFSKHADNSRNQGSWDLIRNTLISRTNNWTVIKKILYLRQETLP